MYTIKNDGHPLSLEREYTMKIILIDPTRHLENGKLLKTKKLLFPSLTLPLLAALTPGGVDVSIIKELFEDINFDQRVDLIGITSYTGNIYRAYEIADEFRKRKVPVVMGGMHVSMEPEEAKEHADTIIIGEAEETWPQFINDFRNGIQKEVYATKKRPLLDHLPIPRFSLLNKSHYAGYHNKGLFRFFFKPVIPVETARGCPHSCDFCSVTNFFGGRYRPRPIDDVVNEIKVLGVKFCFFVDDNIFASPHRAKELFKALLPLRIRWIGQGTISAAEDRELIHLARRSGCFGLSTGIESLSHASLASVGKGINKVEHYERYLKVFRKEGIGIGVTMMFGFDDEEPGVFKEAYDFLVRNRVSLTAWQAIRPQPGTSFYKRLKDQGRLKDAKWWLKPYGKVHCLRFTGTKMAEGEFSENFYHYNRLFYSWKSIIRRTLLPPQQRFPLKIIANLVFRQELARQIFCLNIN